MPRKEGWGPFTVRDNGGVVFVVVVVVVVALRLTSMVDSSLLRDMVV